MKAEPDAKRYRLAGKLAGMDLPDEEGGPVYDADTLLAAFAAGCDPRGQYYASAPLIARLFWWQLTPRDVIEGWRDELVARGDLKVAPLALDIYSSRPIYVATLQKRSRFQRFQARPPIPEVIRQFVYDRDGRKCLHCGTTEELSLDHVHPYSLGGGDEPENLQTLCRPCNSRKGARV